MHPQTDHSPLSLSLAPPLLSTTSILAGMQGPQCQKAQARQEAGRHRWFSEEIPELQKAFPPQAQQSWGLLLVKAPLLVWAAAQTVRRPGQARGRRAAGCVCGSGCWGSRSASRFGTSCLLPWVSHFVQHSNPKEAGESTFHYPANKDTGRRRMKGLGVLNLVWGYLRGFKK